MMDNVSLLSDEDLRAALIQFGEHPGPIVVTTRKVYESKLSKLMQAKEEMDQASALPKVSPQRHGGFIAPAEDGDVGGSNIGITRRSPRLYPSIPTAPADPDGYADAIGPSGRPEGAFGGGRSSDHESGENSDDEMRGTEYYIKHTPTPERPGMTKIFDDRPIITTYHRRWNEPDRNVDASPTVLHDYRPVTSPRVAEPRQVYHRSESPVRPVSSVIKDAAGTVGSWSVLSFVKAAALVFGFIFLIMLILRIMQPEGLTPDVSKSP